MLCAQSHEYLLFILGYTVD